MVKRVLNEEPDLLMKELNVTTYLKCKGGKDASNFFCISGLFKTETNPTFVCLFVCFLCMIKVKWHFHQT